MRSARVTAAIAGAAVLAASLWLGWFDAARSLDLLTGRAVTEATVFALVAALCWLMVAVIAGAVVAGLLGGGRRSLHRASSVLLVGATVLALGVAHHNGGYGVCCANAATAQQAAHRVR